MIFILFHFKLRLRNQDLKFLHESMTIQETIIYFLKKRDQSSNRSTKIQNISNNNNNNRSNSNRLIKRNTLF